MRYPARLFCLALLSLVLAPALTGPAARAAELPPREVQAEVRLAGPAPAVFEQLGKLYAVRVRVEEDFPARTIQLRLREVDFAAALRAATQLAKAFSVVQPDGSVWVVADTPQNRAHYQPQVLKTFFLPGRTPEEVNDAVRLLREVLDMRRIRPDLRSHTFTVRDTPYRLAVAEQLLEQLPAEPGEVLIELLLLEVDREEVLRLGILPPDRAVAVHLGAGALALREDDVDSLLEIVQFLLERGLLPEALTQASLQSLLAAGALDLSQVGIPLPPFILFGGGETTFAANLPGAELNLLQLTRVARSWQRLSLRARAGEEASLFLGQRFPVVFATFSAIFIPEIIQELIRRGEFVPPVPAIQYEELGVRLTVHPRLHPGREISLRFKLDQLALTAQEFNGIPVFSSRSLEQQVRLQEGETMLLAGLRRRSIEETRTGLPLLGSVPVIGHLFRRTARNVRTTELLLLLTPRIVGLPPAERVALRTLYVGTEKEFAPAGRAPAPARERRPAPQRQRPQVPPPQPPPPQPQQPPRRED